MYGIQWTSAETGTSRQLLMTCWAAGNGEDITRLFHLISFKLLSQKAVKVTAKCRRQSQAVCSPHSPPPTRFRSIKHCTHLYTLSNSLQIVTILLVNNTYTRNR